MTFIPDEPLEVRATDEDPDSVVKPYVYQKRMAAVMRNDAIRDAMFEWFRQAGKSTGVSLGINDDILTLEAQRRRTLWTLISRSLPQARELSLKVRNFGRAVAEGKKILLPLRYTEHNVHDLEERTFEIEYPAGSRVICVSSNPDSAAGYTGNIFWDEVGLTPKAREVFRTAFGVTTRRRYRFLMASTPRPGFWCERYDDALTPGSGIYTDHMTIHDGIAQGCELVAEEIRLRLRDEYAWRQEYLCEHLDDELCWLPWELIQSCVDGSATALRSDAEGDVYAGWDLARWHNLSVLVLGEKKGPRIRVCQILIMKRMPFPQQYDLVERACKAYPKFRRLVLDEGGMGEGPADEMMLRFPGRVEGVKFNGLKEALATDIRVVMQERNLLIPDDADFKADLHSIHCTTTAAQHKRFEGEVGDSHADRFWATALLVHAAFAASEVGPFRGKIAPRATFARRGAGGVFS